MSVSLLCAIDLIRKRKGKTVAFLEWADQKVKTRTIWDIGVLKIFCVIVGMIIGAYYAEFVICYQTWFLIAGLLLFIVLVIRFFSGQGKK